MKIKNKKLYLTVIGALLLVFIIIGVSYAYFGAKLIEVNKTETKIKTQVMGLSYSGQTEISCTNMVPGNKCIKTFKVENTSDVEVWYNIYMESITNEFNEDLVYTLTDDNGTVIEETPLPETNASKTYLKKGITIGANATKNYTLTIEYKYLDTPQNDYQGAEFKATVGIDAEQTGDKYKLTGTVVKLLSGGQTETVTSGNLVFFSEKQDIAIQSDGTFEATDLEAGNHEVYYMGTQDASHMTKEQVRANALCEMRTFNILTTTRVELTCKEGIDPVGLDEIVSTIQETQTNIQVGDYIKMTPTLSTYTISIADTGSYNDQTINPSELNVWRVIKINDNGTIDAISQYVSSVNVYFKGKIGYQKYIGTLNNISDAYTNSNYVIRTKHIGYNGQTNYITDTTKLDQRTSPWSRTTSDTVPTALEDEALGAGDIEYKYDSNLIRSVLGTLKAKKVGTSTETKYWLAARQFFAHSSGNWEFNCRFVDQSGTIDHQTIYAYTTSNEPSCSSGCFHDYLNYGYAIRPIITLKSGLIPSSGDGQSEETAWVLN